MTMTKTGKKHWKQLLAAVIVLVFGPYPALVVAQTSLGKLRGTTTAAGPRGQPAALGAAEIKLTGTTPGSATLSTFSNDAGEYVFADLPAGMYTLEANLQGFETVVKDVTITPGVTVTEDLRLELGKLHQRVEVRDQVSALPQQLPAPPATLSAPQFKALPLSQMKFKDVLPVVPGVIRTPNGKISVKGSEENQGLLVLDSAETVNPITGSFAIDLSIGAIQSLEVYKTPYSSEYGGFTGGLTTIEIKPPSSKWTVGLDDFLPGLRGRSGHLVGVASEKPRLAFSGPLLTNKLSMSEWAFYELKKAPVRGLAWPHNETKREGYNSFTNFQYIVSTHHLATLNVHLFPVKEQFENISSLIPQTASSDFGQRGFSVGANDHYQFASGAFLSTLFKYTRFSSYAHGQGPQDMLLTPNGWGGNFFNAWTRASKQEELLQNFQFPGKDWRGRHVVKLGGSAIHRSFVGTSQSRPVMLLRPDGMPAERIDFLGLPPAQARQGLTSLRATNTEVGLFAQDHWAVNTQFSIDLGMHYFGQTLGEPANFAPHLGLVFSPDKAAKTIFRGGVGIFHDRVSLLAGDFMNNPTRIVSLFGSGGAPLGPALPFRNACARAGTNGPRFVPSCADLGSTPYNLTWNFEVERALPGQLTLRVGFLSSRTFKLLVVGPVSLPGSSPLLLLTNTGNSRYQEFESTLRFHPAERSELNISYVWSRARGDLNSLAEVFVPFEQPVIHPNLFATLPSDVPNRLVAWGIFKLPRNLTFSPVVDIHSGFRYSNVDVFQNYVGVPDGQHFPTFFSLDMRVYREFSLPLILKRHKIRLGIYALNFTNHSNPLDVFNNVSSPFFGHFVGFQHRVLGMVTDFVN
jgi:hypothetical protein